MMLEAGGWEYTAASLREGQAGLLLLSPDGAAFSYVYRVRPDLADRIDAWRRAMRKEGT